LGAAIRGVSGASGLDRLYPPDAQDTRDAKDAYLRNRIARDGRIDPEDPELIDWLNDTTRAEVDLDDDSLFKRAA